MRKAIYKAIADRLNAAELGIGYISLWNQNTEQLRQQKAFRLPAVFIAFDPIVWSQRGQGARAADVRVRLHVVTETLATPEVGGKYQDKALEHLDFLEKVAAAMQGLAGDGFNCLMLTETITDHDHEQLRRDELCYITGATDTAGVKPRTTISGIALAGGPAKSE